MALQVLLREALAAGQPIMMPSAMVRKRMDWWISSTFFGFLAVLGESFCFSWGLILHGGGKRLVTPGTTSYVTRITDNMPLPTNHGTSRKEKVLRVGVNCSTLVDHLTSGLPPDSLNAFPGK